MRLPLAAAVLVPLALSLAACSGASTGADSPQTDAASFQPTVPAGTLVYVNRGGQWLPGSVVRQTAAQSVLVHYDGAPPEYDEDVPFERVRSRPAPAADYKAGETVLVTAQNRLYLAEVRQELEGGMFRVRYSGFGAEAVDNVQSDRIQRPFTGVTAFPVGTPVQVTAPNGQPYPGKVIAAVRADQWIVRLDGAGAEYDQIVGPDRIQPLTGPAPSLAPTAPATTAAAPATTATAPAGTTKAPAPAAPPPIKAGDAVLLQVRSVYYPAKVAGPGAAQGTWKVRVQGAAADEEVPEKQLARLLDPLKGVKYKVGQEVFVEWHGIWAPGKVVKDAGGGSYTVRPEGKGAEADEMVPVNRLRPRN